MPTRLVQPSPLSPLACAKLAKELDERLEYVQAQEAKLADIDNDLTVIESSIVIRQKQLDALTTAVDTPDPMAVKKKHDLEKGIKELEQQHARATKELRVLQPRIRTATASFKHQSTELATINQEIAQRKKYLNEQEVLINKAIEEGNMNLKSILYQSQDLEEQKQGVAAELYALNQQKSNLLDDVVRVEQVVAAAQKDHFAQLMQLEEVLDSKRQDLSVASAKLEEVTTNTDHKLAVLKEKETSLIAREDALLHDKEELKTAQRRFAATRDLYS